MGNYFGSPSPVSPTKATPATPAMPAMPATPATPVTSTESEASVQQPPTLPFLDELKTVCEQRKATHVKDEDVVQGQNKEEVVEEETDVMANEGHLEPDQDICGRPCQSSSDVEEVEGMDHVFPVDQDVVSLLQGRSEQDSGLLPSDEDVTQVIEGEDEVEWDACICDCDLTHGPCRCEVFSPSHPIHYPTSIVQDLYLAPPEPPCRPGRYYEHFPPDDAPSNIPSLESPSVTPVVPSWADIVADRVPKE